MWITAHENQPHIVPPRQLTSSMLVFSLFLPVFKSKPTMVKMLFLSVLCKRKEKYRLGGMKDDLISNASLVKNHAHVKDI